MIGGRIRVSDQAFPIWSEVIVSIRALDRKYRWQVECVEKSSIRMRSCHSGLLFLKWALDLGVLDHIGVLDL